MADHRHHQSKELEKVEARVVKVGEVNAHAMYFRVLPYHHPGGRHGGPGGPRGSGGPGYSGGPLGPKGT